MLSNLNYFSDISANNPSFNAAQYASAGYGAIAIKATEGDGYTNPHYADWVASAHAHRLPVFHYHFSRPENGDPYGQVEHFWDTVRPHFHRPGDYVVFDVETDTPANAARWLNEADSKMHSLSGTHPICYCPLSFYEEGNLAVESHDFWIAAWGNVRPGSRWGLGRKNRLFAWQYNGGVGLGEGPHQFAGVPGNPDGSQMNPQLARYLRRLKEHRGKGHK